MQLMISDDLAEVQAYLRQTDAPVIVDIETTSLRVEAGQLLCVAFAPYDREDVMVWWPQDRAELAKLRIPKMVAHNSPFEERWLKAYGCRVRTVWDTMFMAYLIDENHPIGLKELARRLLGYEDWSDDNVAGFGDEFGQMWEDRDIPPKAKKRVSIYNGMDVHATRELMKWQRRHIRKNLRPHEDPVRVMRSVMLPAVEPLRQMEDNRLPVRTARVAKVREYVEGQIAAIEQKLDASIPPKEEWPDWLQKTKVNWGNTNWTKWWLYVHQGAMVPARTKPTKTWPEGNPSLAAENLGKIDHPAARLLMQRATLYKQLTGFLVPIETRTRNGRIGTIWWGC